MLFFALPALAQTEIVSITDWRVQEGDNPAWAQPTFDDSGWQATSFPRMAFSDASAIGWHWYRASFSIPEDLRGHQISLGMAALDDVYEVYLDGVPIARFGSFTPAPHAIYPRHMVFAVPQSLLHGTLTHIAVRRWRGPWAVRLTDSSAAGTANFHHPPQLGSTDAITAREQLDMARGAIQMLPAIFTCILFLMAAAISVVLFSAQRRRAEYLYLALFCLTRGAPHFAGLFASTSSTIDSRSWGPVLTFFVTSCSHGFSALLLAALCPRYRKILLAGAALSGVIAVLLGCGMAVDAGFEFPVLFLKDAAPVAFQMVAVWGLLRDREKGSLTIGVSLFLESAIWLVASIRVFMRLTPNLTLGPFFLDYRDAAGAAFIFVVLLVLYLRYRDEQARQTAIDQDLAAARRMQEQLLAGSALNPPGFIVEAVYRPAKEVGGDFYRTVALADGSLLVVVGDVSGKGLDAAMLVAVILGSVANETERNPASLLAYMNRAVVGRTGGGFITACCAHFFPDGRVVIANAGHIAPCLNAHELETDNGLPLGISPHATYMETEINASGAVTFMSDGVVEARNAQGELLGFDRMAALTLKPASQIADAAQQWGQEDDITVLTVRCLHQP